jgi:formate-dependent nitrite reductase membrane component NrfD
MTRGEHAVAFWALAVGIGMVVPLALAIIGLVGADAVAVTVAAGGAALVGLYPYEDAFVRAGQAVPLS